MTGARTALYRTAITIFVLLVIGFFAFALASAWNATNGAVPSAPRLAAAAGLFACGLLVGAFAWATLLGGNRRVDHGAALLVTQLAKYVPGGVWQATGQVGLARAAGVPVRRGAVTFSVLAITQAVAGCTYALLLAAVWTDLAVAWRVLLAVGSLATLLLIDRRWMVWLLRRIPRTREASQELVPPQRAIVIAWAASVVTVGVTSLAYLVLLAGFGRVHDPLRVVAAYATAWTAGFVAVPIPSGLGVRESVLAGIMPSGFPSSVIVAASVYHRLVAIATEGVMAAIASHRLRPSRTAALRAAELSMDADADGVGE